MHVLGIDHGTSTTLAAQNRDGKIELVKNDAGDEVIHSFVAFTPSGKVQVGSAARARRLINPGNTLYSVKRILGRPWRSEQVQQFIKQYPFMLERGADDVPRFSTRAGPLTAAEIVSYMLAHLKELPALNGKLFDGVTMTVPILFDRQQRDAALAAAARAGFQGVTLLDEPCAAALAIIGNDTRDRTAVVYDLGGGTFDLAVLSFKGGTYRLLAAGGDPFLGGDDIDRRCGAWAAQQILSAHRWDVRSSPKSWETLLYICEQAKIRLSTLEETTVNLSPVDPVLEGKSLAISRAQIESLCSDLVRRTFVLCDEVVGRAGIRAREIDDVIISGGGGYMPAIRRGVEQYFGRASLDTLPPDRLVAIGAAVHAGTRGGTQVRAA